MPFSPSRNVTALSVEAVFMNAGSSVTRPVFARKLEMSIPFSSSVPSTTCNSISCLAVTMRTVSGTASLLRSDRLSGALSRGGAKESRAQAREQFADFKRRIAEIIGGGERRTFAEAPCRRADADARRPGGGHIDRAVAHQPRILRARAEGGADAQETVRGRFSRRFISADHHPECGLDPQTPQELARKAGGFVREDPARLGRGPQQRCDAIVEPRLRQQALCVVLAPDRRRLRVPRLVRRAQRAADQPFSAFADESMDHPGLALGKEKAREHRVDAVRQIDRKSTRLNSSH